MKRVYPTIGLIIAWLGVHSQEGHDTLHFDEVVVLEEAPEHPASVRRTEVDSMVRLLHRTNTLSQLLSSNTGIHMKQYGAGGIATPSFRGTGAGHTQVLWNGMPLNSPMLGLSDFGLYPAILFDDMKINHGAASLDEVTGAFGGSIELKNRHQPLRGLDWSALASIGSFGKYTGMAYGGYGSKKAGSRSRFLIRDNENNYPYLPSAGEDMKVLDHGDFRQYNLMQQLYYNPTDQEQIVFDAWYLYSDRNIPPLLIGNPDTWYNQVDEQLVGVLQYTHSGDKGYWKLHSGWQQHGIRFRELNEAVYGATLDAKSGFRIFRQQVARFQRLTSKVTVRGVANTAIESATADGYRGGVSRLRSSLSGTLKYRAGDRWSADLHLRQGMVDRQLLPFATRIGITGFLSKTKTMSVYGNAGRNVRYPGLNDLYWVPGGNPDLKAEIDVFAELGARYSRELPAHGKISVEVNGFRGWVQNWIRWTPPDSVFAAGWHASNINSVRRQGLESGIKYTTITGPLVWRAETGYTYTHTFEDTRGRQLIYIPFHTGFALVSVHYRQFFLGYDHRYTGRQYITRDHSYYLPEYSLANIRGGVEFSAGNLTFNLLLSVENLMNTQYQVVAYRPMPGRMFSVSLKTQWK